MNTKSKRLITWIMMLALMATMVVASAVVTEDSGKYEIQPRYTGVSNVLADLSITASGRADVYGKVRVNSGYTADVTVELQRDSGITVKSWSTSGSGTLTIDKSYYVTSGHDYYTVIYVDVYNSNGKLVDSIEDESSVVSY